MERKKIKLQFDSLTLDECMNKFINDCEVRGLRKDTIRHYKSAIKTIYNYIDPQLSIDMINQELFEEYSRIQNLRDDITSQSKKTNIQDLKIILNYFIREGLIEEFKMKLPVVDKTPIETYTEEEIKVLLKEPKSKSFAEYRDCCVVNLLFSTGLRLSSLINIKVCDIDFDTHALNLTHTKNHKALIVPLSNTIVNILRNYIRIACRGSNDWLFCNVYGDKLKRSTISHNLVEYNHSRGVNKTGIHRWRHTFAKYWIVNGGSVVVLSRILGHSNLKITQNYINLLVSDLKKEVDEIDIINKYSRKAIKLK